MNTPQDILGQISGGRVLDVATGRGGFIHLLLDELKDYTEIIGIDTNQDAARSFADSFKDKPNIRFEKMDALHLDFKDDRFDTVCMANSLHHFNEPQAVLHEMARVLRPGGYFILTEMYRDGQTETQMSHVLLHHWWAAVDRADGIIHNETFLREEIVALVTGLGLDGQALLDLSATNENPKEAENLANLNSIIDHDLQRAEGHPDLQQRGEELRNRLREIGIHSAATLIAVGKKPGIARIAAKPVHMPK